MPANIHRIGVAVKDLDASIDYYTKFFGGDFRRTGEAVSQEAGVEVAADWALGIELVHPVPGSENPIAQRMEKFLERHGDGVFGVGFVVDDMDAAIARAAQAGTEPLLPTFKFTEEQLQEEFAGAFARFEETPMDSEEKCGLTYAFNIIEDA